MSQSVDRNDDPERPFGGYREDGLYVFGPTGMRCSLAALIANSLLRVSGSTVAGLRRAHVRDRAAYLRRKYTIPALQAMDVARRQMQPCMMRVGDHLKPAGKRPNSGRKRRAA